MILQRCDPSVQTYTNHKYQSCESVFLTTFLSKLCLVWNAWAWYAEGGTSPKMWFSPNHRANHALWFWFPCITGLKLWNHLMHTGTHPYTHTNTCMCTQLSRYRFGIQTHNPTRTASHHRHEYLTEFHSRNHSTMFNEKHLLWRSL